MITDSGLSGGAIAGIVIGSLLGAALIGGAVYYFAFYDKSKGSSVSPSEQEVRTKQKNAVSWKNPGGSTAQFS